jgi:GNAT superfamily N-acetyltransferase
LYHADDSEGYGEVNFCTLDHWNEAEWRRAAPIFDEGFPPFGRKTEAMIRKIVDRNEGYLHLCDIGGDRVAMAVTGKLPDLGALLIDYVAVEGSRREQGIGREMIAFITEEARRLRFRGIVIEVEAETNEDNEGRKRFWQSLGFQLTAYIHHYRWVPETYQAMYFEWDGNDNTPLPRDGRVLFDSIMNFHGKIYRKN